MHVVIDISKEQYSLIMQSHRNGVARFVDKEAMMYAIKNGTPLPKGHGRLIDECLTVDDVFKAVIESLLNKGLAEGDAPTIIEADTPKMRKGTPLEENDSGYNCEDWIP